MSQNDSSSKAAIIGGIFAVIAACVGGGFLLVNTLLEKSLPTSSPEAGGPGVQLVTATSTPPPASLSATLAPQTRTSTATNTPLLPTNTPIPSCPTPTFFQDIWKMHPQLGCPTNASTSDFTLQEFERGILAWQKSPSPSTIYAFYHNGRWERQTDPGGPPRPSCPEAEQTNGLGPISSFGTLWCEPWNWKEQLGTPTSGEYDGKNNQIQDFEKGTILTVGAAGGFILYSDSHWEPF